MKVIIDEAGEIIAKATDDHTLIGGHHRLSVAASLGKRLFWRDTGEPVKLDLFFKHYGSSFDIQPEPLAEHIILASRGTEAVKATEAVHARDGLSDSASCNGGCRHCQRCLGQDNGR